MLLLYAELFYLYIYVCVFLFYFIYTAYCDVSVSVSLRVVCFYCLCKTLISCTHQTDKNYTKICKTICTTTHHPYTRTQPPEIQPPNHVNHGSRSPTSPGSWNDEDGALSSVSKWWSNLKPTSSFNIKHLLLWLKTHKSDYDHHQQSNQSSAYHNNNNSSDHPLSSTLRDTVDSKAGQDHVGGYDGQSLEGNLENETKSISSMKSGGSTSQDR